MSTLAFRVPVLIWRTPLVTNESSVKSPSVVSAVIEPKWLMFKVVAVTPPEGTAIRAAQPAVLKVASPEFHGTVAVPLNQFGAVRFQSPVPPSEVPLPGTVSQTRAAPTLTHMRRTRAPRKAAFVVGGELTERH